MRDLSTVRVFIDLLTLHYSSPGTLRKGLIGRIWDYVMDFADEECAEWERVKSDKAVAERMAADDAAKDTENSPVPVA